MAISINDVYTTTLTLLNKEQRGYVTPAEFNQIAGVVQNEIFEGYFQKAAVPDDMDSDLANIGQQYKEKLQPFVTHVSLSYLNEPETYSPLEINDLYRVLDFYPRYEDVAIPIKADRVSSMEANSVNLSPLVAPTKHNPIVVYETEVPGLIVEANNYPGFRIYPYDVLSVDVHYIKTPSTPNWIGTSLNGQIVPFLDNVDYQNFDLHVSDYSEVVARVLLYFGISTRSDEILAVAGSKEQQNSAI